MDIHKQVHTHTPKDQEEMWPGVVRIIPISYFIRYLEEEKKGEMRDLGELP